MASVPPAYSTRFASLLASVMVRASQRLWLWIAFSADLDFVTISALRRLVLEKICGRSSSTMPIAEDVASVSVTYLPSDAALVLQPSRSFHAAPTPILTSLASSTNSVVCSGWSGSIRIGIRESPCVQIVGAVTNSPCLQGRSKPYSVLQCTCLTICCASLLPNSRCVFSSLFQPMLDGCGVPLS
jgi:hypothetical protein